MVDTPYILEPMQKLFYRLRAEDWAIVEEAILHIRALSGAVEAERERCAKIADQTEPFESEKIGSFEALLAFYYGRDCVAHLIRSG